MLYFKNFNATQGVKEFIEEKIDESDFAMTLTEMNKKHTLFGSDFRLFLMSIIYKMPIIIFQNDSKGLLMVINSNSLYSVYELRDPPARVHPTCHLYLLSYYCLMHPSNQNEFNHYIWQLKEGEV